MIYFDNAATTGKKPKSVINAVNYALNNLCANPGRSGHFLSQSAAIYVYNTRKSVADYFNSDGPETVVFTSNCTHSINIVLKGVLNKNDHIVISDLEHNAVMRPLTSMDIDYSVATVSLIDDEETVINFKNAVNKNTKMIFCTAASNVLGKTLPLKQIGKFCKANNILFAVDAAQGAGMMPIDMDDMCIDYLCVAAHKGLYSPMGLGVLIVRGPIKKTIIEGGTGTESKDFKQPDILPEMLESGTLNLPAIVALNEGIKFVRKNSILLEYENNLIKQFYNKMQKTDLVFYTDPTIASFTPVISFNVNGYSSEETGEFLSKNGFALRSGLHCAPAAHQKINTLDCGTVRLSPSIFNTVGEIDRLILCLKNFKKRKICY